MWNKCGKLDFSHSFDYTSVVKSVIILLSMTLNNIIRLSVSEAARLFGVSQRTIRRAIADGKVNYVVVQGRYKINFESLLRWSQDSTTVRNKRDSAGIGQYVGDWNIKNKLYSPNPKALKDKENKNEEVDSES